MFGHDHDEHKSDNNHEDKLADGAASDTANQSSDAPGDDRWQHPGPPPSDDDLGESQDQGQSDTSADHDPNNVSGPGQDDSPHMDYEDTADSTGGFAAGQSDSNHASNGLIDLKQEALTKLSPLVDHLDQSPDEKFRTLMMMIQASDNQALVHEAYQTALKIDDEKERAQALLDIVNEINYFTQNPKSE